jgi:hypothetical protein
MHNPHRRAGFIYVLSAGASGAVKINLEVILFYFDIDILIKFRDAIYRCETCMPSLVCIERAYPYQPMNANLTR